MSPNPNFLTATEVASRWGVSLRTIRAMIASGELRAVRVGARLVRIPVEAVTEAERPYTAGATA